MIALAILCVEGDPQSMVNNSAVAARLAMLPFAALLWLTGWSARFLPIPIKNPLVSIVAQLTLGVILFGDMLGQMFVYRFLSGIRGKLSNNDVFFKLFLGELVIGLCLIFSSAFALRRKERNEYRQ